MSLLERTQLTDKAMEKLMEVVKVTSDEDIPIKLAKMKKLVAENPEHRKAKVYRESLAKAEEIMKDYFKQKEALEMRTGEIDPGTTGYGTEETVPMGSARICRICGCTDDNACPEICWWVSWDLCSECCRKHPERATEEEKQMYAVMSGSGQIIVNGTDIKKTRRN